MKHVVAHGLPDRARARTVVSHALESYRERLSKYQPTVTWNGDDSAEVAFEVMAKRMAAKVFVDDRNVTFEGKVPLLLRPFENKAVEVLDREIRRWLAKAHAGEI